MTDLDDRRGVLEEVDDDIRGQMKHELAEKIGAFLDNWTPEPANSSKFNLWKSRGQ